KCRVDARRRMRRSRSTRDEADSRTPGELCVRFGHVRGAGLVPCDDQPDRSIAQRVENGDVALARDAERRVDAVDAPLVDEDPGAGTHYNEMGWSKNTVARCSFGFASSAGS